MTIIGVSDESAGVVKSFVEKNDMKYTIALGGANEYKSSGIPHSWLVSPGGEIVWEGHPASLNESIIETNIRSAKLTPEFKLPRELKEAQKHLDTANYAAGIKALESHLKAPKSPLSEKAAKEAIESVQTLGKDKLKEAEESAKARDYADAQAVLDMLSKSFKGTETGDKAKEMLASFQKDKTIKNELEGSAIIEKANELIRDKKYRPAASLLLQVTKVKKFEGTKVRELADKKFASIEKKL